MRFLLAALILLSNVSLAIELGEIEVNATKTQTKSTFLTNSYYYEGEEKLKNSSFTYVLDQIRRIPGIYVKQTGGPLGESAVYMRGMKARHVLILIDGVPTNDPASVDGAADLSLTNLENIESIEVLKGSQSVLYGGEAMAGVILITTKKVKEKKGTIVAGGGNVENTYLGLGYNYFKGDFITNFFVYEDRFSGMSRARGEDFEKDLAVNEGADIVASYPFSNKLDYQLNLKIHRATYDLDDGAYDDNDDYVGKNNRNIFANKIVYKHNKIYTSELSVNKFYLDRETNNRNTSTELKYTGYRTNVEYLFKYKEQRKILVAGISYEKEDVVNEFNNSESLNESYNEKSAFARYERHFDDYFYNVGARLDHNSSFGTFNALSLGLGDFKGKTKRFVNIGTGIKFPTLFQLYDPTNGNEDLLPEKSVSLDLGIERFYLKATYGIVVYVTQNTGAINFVDNTYKNSGDYKSSGFEYYVKKEIDQNFTLGFSYNMFYVRNIDKDDIPFIPEHKLNYNLAFKKEKHFAELNIDFFGTQFIDTNGNEQKSFALTNLVYAYDINEDHNISLAANNIFNRDYQQVYGYNSLGRNAFLKYRYRY